jgi:hypothetical protein
LELRRILVLIRDLTSGKNSRGEPKKKTTSLTAAIIGHRKKTMSVSHPRAGNWWAVV